MRDRDTIDRYDLNKLIDAMKLISEVVDYNYGATGMNSTLNRLNTIHKKLGELIVIVNADVEEKEKHPWKFRR